MITFNDVEKIFVSSSCQQCSPCRHISRVALEDGRSVSSLSNFEIWSIISNIAKERINPGNSCDVDGVREHFRACIALLPESDLEAETPEAVLNRIFSEKYRCQEM